MRSAATLSWVLGQITIMMHTYERNVLCYTLRTMKYGFAPVINRESRLLILGSLPGDESIRQQRYYAHPKNQFWPILASVFGEPIHSNYDDRIRFLKRNGVALWDVLLEAERPGSLDSAIRKEVVNDFQFLFRTYPNLQKILFNGQKAESLFRRYVIRQNPHLHEELEMIGLPSSSPTPGRGVLSFERKIEKWKNAIERLTPSRSAPHRKMDGACTVDGTH